MKDMDGTATALTITLSRARRPLVWGFSVMGNGHFWVTLQAIKRPTLLEHPSAPARAGFDRNLQYRLTEVEGDASITFHHNGARPHLRRVGREGETQ